MNKINPNHKNQQNLLRTVGPIILVIGLCFLATGMISFFTASAGHAPPKYFWCAFVGMPTSAIGLALTKWGYMGKISRYTAGEIAPVAKDTFNYLAKETKEGVSSISENLSSPQNKSQSTIEERIKKLEKLKLSGVINEEDFEEQKDRILSEI